MTDDADDMHQHRRSTDTDDLHGHRLQAVADSTAARVLNRLLTPALGVLLTVISFFLVRMLNDVAETQIRQAARTEGLRSDLAQVKSDVRVITTRLDEGVVRQVNSNTISIQDHEHRLQVIERAVKTP